MRRVTVTVAATTGPRVGDLLDTLAQPLAGLLGPEPAAALRARLPDLPVGAISTVGFEQGLSDPAAAVDLSLRLAPAARLQRHRAELAAVHPALGHLVDALCRPDPTIDDSWLEYDLGSGDAAAPPSLFARPLTPGAASPLAALLGARPAEHAALDALIDALDEDDRIQQVAVMHSRAGTPLRCILQSARPGRTAGLEALRRRGWTGDLAAAERYMALVPLHSVALGFAPDGRPDPRVGVELVLPWPADVDRLLTALEADGLAAPGSRSALLAWHGHAPLEGPAAEPFAPLVALTGGRRRPAVVRRVNHVKLTLAPGQPLTAKVYPSARLVIAG
jgi:hypothetical protein